METVPGGLDAQRVSYAMPGAGVGPHFDSYDVFLLQGMGHHRWQIGAQSDLSLIEGLPLKILRRFEISRSGCSAPATCCICRPAMPTTESPSTSA